MRIICFIFFTLLSIQTALASSGAPGFVFVDFHEKESMEISLDEIFDAVASNKQNLEELDFEDKVSFQYFYHNIFNPSHVMDVQTPPPKAA